jgi:FkbM family methyltransferase
MYSLKIKIKKFMAKLISLISSTKLGEFSINLLIRGAMDRVIVVKYGMTTLKFSTPNPLNVYRAKSFEAKEPETLKWIDEIPKGSVMWDIGANVGLYSCYAAKSRGCRVYAFEPSVFNLELLARNIFINGVVDLISIISLPLFDKVELGKLSMTTTDWGGAMSTFGETYGHDGEPIKKVFEFSTFGISMDEAMKFFHLEMPDYIKMDVDGIEHLILKGGVRILENVKGILIEINDNFHTQSEDAFALLSAAGLTFLEKKHAEIFDHVNTAAKHTYNQIWVR